MSGAYQYGHFPRGMRFQLLVVRLRKSNQDQTIIGDAGEKRYWDRDQKQPYQRASPRYFGNGFRIFERYIDQRFVLIMLGVQIVWNAALDHSIWQAGVPMLCRPWTVSFVAFWQHFTVPKCLGQESKKHIRVEAKWDLEMLNISIVNRHLKMNTWGGWV